MDQQNELLLRPKQETSRSGLPVPHVSSFNPHFWPAIDIERAPKEKQAEISNYIYILKAGENIFAEPNIVYW